MCVFLLFCDFCLTFSLILDLIIQRVNNLYLKVHFSYNGILAVWSSYVAKVMKIRIINKFTELFNKNYSKSIWIYLKVNGGHFGTILKVFMLQNSQSKKNIRTTFQTEKTEHLI